MKSVQHDLEEMIDKHGLKEVVNMLESICYDKESHVRENWQDDGLADDWSADAKTLCAAYNKIRNSKD